MSSNNADLMVGNRPLSSLRVVDLKQELEKRGLSKSGSKKDLVDRLRLHLQIEKHRDTGASADEEELPNYSQVHDELADQNPFIRDYLASQAELFHSQKVVKKLVEEEAKRESETSADESGDSPVKQPSKLDREDSPVTETRRQSRRRVDSQSQREDMTAEKLATRSSRSRSPAAATTPAANTQAKTNDVPVQNEQAKQCETEIAVSPEKPQQKLEESSPSEDKVETVANKEPEIERKSSEPDKEEEDSKPEVTAHPNLQREEEASSEEVVKDQAVDEEEKDVVVSREEVKNQEVDEVKKDIAVISDDVKDQTVDEEKKDVSVSVDENTSKSRSSSPQPVEKKSEEVVENCKEAEKEKKETVVEEKLVETTLPEESMDADSDREENDKEPLSSAPEDTAASKTLVSKREASPAPKTKEDSGDILKVKPVESESSSEDERSSKSRSRSRSRSKSRSRSRSNESREDSRSRGEDDKRSEPEEKDEESQEVPRIKTSKSRSASRSPVREKTPEKPEPPAPEKMDESEAKSDGQPTEAAEKMDVEESSSPRYKSSQKETSYTNNDIAGEEALDYGEEEDDEDRNESDAQEFPWARRSLRFKIKSTFAAPAHKWKLEEESKYLVVKSDLLNSYYEDIKLVPLEQLKLEEKAAEASSTESKKEIERKPSISKEAEEPLLTRTVENVAPTIKRTVSIIPSTKTPTTEVPEESDKALTPPRNPPTDVLLITNLVRPFTLIQLKEMLQRTGNLQDIWVDKIKSKCIAKFGSQEEAFETRAALHGVCWPNSNPKSLHVDYTTQDNLDEHKAKEGAEQSATIEKPVSAQPVPVREWDVGKKAEPKSPGRNRKRSRSRSTSRDRNKRSRRSPSPGRRRRSKSPAHERRNRGGEGKEPEPMGKALDELFRKTVATPSIYWLPLTPEQIAEKEELRRKRMLERERRLAELSKMRPR